MLGKSGSGKSTLLNILGGLDKVSRGEIYFNEFKFSTFKSKDYDYYRSNVIGFVFQEYHLIEEFNVYQNIKVALDIQNTKAHEAMIETYLEMVDLKGYAKREVNELSGGQKQRVAIARALAKNPKIILADEPTGSLDSKTSEDIFKLLKKLSQDKLIIIVSHDQEAAYQYGDHVIEIKDGRIVSEVTLKILRKPY